MSRAVESIADSRPSTKPRDRLLVGAGAVATTMHLPNLLKSLEGNIYVFDIDRTRIQQLNVQFRHEPRVRFVSRIPEQPYALIVIATPPRSHVEYFRSLAQLSEAFVIEKPLAVTTAECEEIVNVTAARGLITMVPLVRRMLPTYSLLRSVYRLGKFGQLRTASLHEGSVYSWNSTTTASFSWHESRGGVLIDTGPHALDSLNQVFDDVRLERAYVDAAQPSVEANCQLDLIADDLIPTQVLLSRNRYLSNRLTLQFEEAVLSVGVRSNRIRVHLDDANGFDMVPRSPFQSEDPSLFELFGAFYEKHVERLDPEGLNATDSLAIAKTIDMAYRNAEITDKGF